MRISDKIKGLFGQARKYCSEEELQEGADGLAFTVSLLPIPGVQQVGQVVDRILSSRAIKKQFDEVWERINQINADIEIKTDDLEKLQTAALTVQHNSELSHQLEQLLKDIITDFNKNAGTEWIMETENWSFQQLLNSTVEADFAAVIAKDHSTNVVENSEIKAKKTHLHASGGSQNYFNGTHFVGEKGSVGMNNISTHGNVSVQDTTIGFHGKGGTLAFGGNPNIVKGNCSICGFEVKTDKRQLVGIQYIDCPQCHHRLIVRF